MALLNRILVAAALLAVRQEPRRPTWDDFPAFVWRQEHGGEALPLELFEPFGGTNIERDEDATWVRERGGTFYVGHAPGRNALHLRREGRTLQLSKTWYRTRDPSLLVRVPCLTDPATRSELFTQLEKSLAARGGDHGLGISLGDEISLTPWGDPSDVCRSATCQAAWRAWCEARALDPAAAPTTDEVRVAFADGETDLLGPWLARRRFHQDVVVSLLRELATRARALAPGVPVGALGMAGRTAFGGVALELALPFLDFVETYPVEDARELAMTGEGPRPRRLATVFPEAGGPNAAAWQVWEHFVRGGDGVVLWSDRELARDAGLRRRLARTVAEVRRVHGALDAWRPVTNAVALVHAPDSIALAWLQDALLDGPTWPNRLARYQREHGTRDRSLRAWLLLLEDAGVLPGAVPLDRVDAGTRERFGVLVLSHVLVLDDDDVARLERFVRAGGQLVVEGDLGRFDSRGRPRQDDVRTRLEEAAQRSTGVVHSSPERLVDYPALRRKVRSERAGASSVPFEEDAPTRAEVLRSVVRDWVAAAPPADGAPFSVEGGRLPWLCASTPTENGWACAAIPNASTELERSELVRVEAELNVPRGMRIEWIHPAGDRPPTEEASVTRFVEAGDALVFRLVRE